MTILTLGLYVYDVVRYFSMGLYSYGWLLVFMIVAALLNVILFKLLSDRSMSFGKSYKNTVNMREYKNMRQNFREQKPEEPAYRHHCEICGRTDRTNPELEFRYCTRCAGYHEYCQDHIYTHIHHTEGG